MGIIAEPNGGLEGGNFFPEGGDGGADNSGAGAIAGFLGGGNSADGSGDVDSAGERFDGSVHTGERKSDGTWKRKRGRKVGSGNSSSTSKRQNRTTSDHQASVEYLGRMLGYVHLGFGSAIKAPEIAGISKEENEAIATATVRVLDEFDIRPDPKVEAIVGLIVTAGSVYGPRVAMISMRKRKERDNDE